MTEDERLAMHSRNLAAMMALPDDVYAAHFGASGKPFGFVIGMDVLERGDLSMERAGAVTFDFKPL